MYAIGAGITAGAGTRLVLQLILIDFVTYRPLQTSHSEAEGGCYFSSLPQLGVAIGQFARLLPTLVVVAVSQAPSPVPNPNSPLPVTATVGHYPTDKLIGQIVFWTCAA